MCILSITKIRRTWIAGMTTMLAWFVCTCPALAESREQTKAKIKVAMVYNLINFVGWGDVRQIFTDNRIDICLAAPNVIDRYLGELEAKPIAGISVNYYGVITASEGISCDIIYVPEKGKGQVALVQYFNTKDGAQLIIGEGKDFAANGGGFGIFEKSEQMRFAVNLKSIRGNGFTVSSKLLQLADEIIKD